MCITVNCPLWHCKCKKTTTWISYDAALSFMRRSVILQIHCESLHLALVYVGCSLAWVCYKHACFPGKEYVWYLFVWFCFHLLLTQGWPRILLYALVDLFAEGHVTWIMFNPGTFPKISLSVFMLQPNSSTNYFLVAGPLLYINSLIFVHESMQTLL